MKCKIMIRLSNQAIWQLNILARFLGFINTLRLLKRQREISMGQRKQYQESFQEKSLPLPSGHGIPSIDCRVGMECISGYEDALNMSAYARFKFHTNNDEPKYTCHQILMAAVTTPSPLWHKKVLHIMRGYVMLMFFHLR